MITDPKFFVGRKDELNVITTRMVSGQPVSINIVGKRRIGKSSLLYHFFQTYEQRVQNSDRYIVIYVDLLDALCHNEVGFYQKIVQELLNRPKVKAQTGLTNVLNGRTFDRLTFSAAMKEWKRQGVLPVLCLDEFGSLLKHQTEFNNDFFDNLHSLMNNCVLMLVIASHETLDTYRQHHQLTSSFFNVGQVLRLGDLTEAEAKELVSLPARMGVPAALSTDEQRLAKEWAENHPLLLQLACTFLWEARQQGQYISWAKQRFIQEARRVPKSRFHPRQWRRPLRFVFWDLPLSLGNLTKSIGGGVNEVIAWGIGIFLMIAIILAIFGLIPGSQVYVLFKKFLCSTLSGALGKWCDV